MPSVKTLLERRVAYELQRRCGYDRQSNIVTHFFAFKFPYLDNPFDRPLEQLSLHQIDSGSAYHLNAITTEDKIVAPRFTDAIPLSMLLSKNGLKV